MCPACLPACPPLQVENIALLSNAQDNGFVGVNLYADDEGSIRGLPRNLRASEIALCCGKPLEVGGGCRVGWESGGERDARGGAGTRRQAAGQGGGRKGESRGEHAANTAACLPARIFANNLLTLRPPLPAYLLFCPSPRFFFSPQVKGDAFLARVYDNGEDFERMDLELSEVSSGAAWVKQAKQQNDRKRQQVGPVGQAGGRAVGGAGR